MYERNSHVMDFLLLLYFGLDLNVAKYQSRVLISTLNTFVKVVMTFLTTFCNTIFR
jgi:hypothetical protein